MNANHAITANKFEEEVNNLQKKSKIKSNQERKGLIYLMKNFKKNCYKISFQKGWCVAKRIFARVLGRLIVKNQLPM